MSDEIEFLVNETFRHHKENFDKQEHSFSDGPGVMGMVSKSASSLRAFCMASEDLSEDAQLYEQLPSTFSEFKNVPSSELTFFPCSPKEALYIVERMHGKRFFLQDDLASNLISPSDYWWLIKDGSRVEISFDTQRSDNAIRLGPIGDKKISKEFFNCGYKLFKDVLDIEDYYVSDSSFSFKLDETNPYSQDLLALFETGVIGEDIDELFKLPAHKIIIKRFLSFLKASAAVRRFWLEISNER